MQAPEVYLHSHIHDNGIGARNRLILMNMPFLQGLRGRHIARVEIYRILDRYIGRR